MADVAGSAKTKAVLEGFGGSLGSYSGELEFQGDHDWIAVTLTAGKGYQFFLSLQDTGSEEFGDAYLAVRDKDGVIIDERDSGGVGLNPEVPIGATYTGTYYLDISAFGENETGSYSIIAIDEAGGKLLTPFDDVYSGVSGDERIVGGIGADRITIDGGTDAFGEQGNDVI